MRVVESAPLTLGRDRRLSEIDLGPLPANHDALETRAQGIPVEARQPVSAALRSFYTPGSRDNRLGEAITQP